MTRITTLDFPTFHRSTIGFDKMFNELNRSFANSQSNGYPPYNIVRESDEKWRIELALAGWKKEDIEVSTQQNVLCVKSRAQESKPDAEEYAHKGLSLIHI